VELQGLEALKFLYRRGDYAKAKEAGYVVLWNDIRQPEALFYLASSLEKLNDREQAAVFYRILLRALDEDSKSDPRAASRKATAQKALDRLDGSYRAAQKKYADAAEGKSFTSPDQVSDLWMTQVRCDLRPLHGLYAWKLVGGRKDAKPDWIHNTQGAMHRSGAKLMDEIQGRRGVLFCIPNKKSDKLSRLMSEPRALASGLAAPSRSRLRWVGTMAYGFPYLLNVLVGSKQLFSKTIGKDKWEDLKITLDVEITKENPVTLELVVPEDQRWMEGIFFDYVDFFED
jgi:hypothetical protein